VAYEFKLPDLGEGLTEGEVARWLVSEGQDVREDDPLVEVQTDKTTVEIPSPAAGRVARILVAEGEIVPVGTVLVVIGGDGTAPSKPAPSQGQSLGLGRATHVLFGHASLRARALDRSELDAELPGEPLDKRRRAHPLLAL
jgi:pyruvate/2-oxoglutarate dehydrogenase complex dihydrolipoamide acyltransferase (E2) component